MKDARILIVDDEEVVCRSCALLLSEEGSQVDTFHDARQGLAAAEQTSYDVILLDLKMPVLNGMELLRRIKGVRPDVEVILMTGYAEISTAVEAIKLGAFDYVPKPFDPNQLTVCVRKAVETHRIRAENRYLRSELQSRYKFENIVGNSREMQSVYEMVTQVCGTNVTVLIRGESGTGKELVARAIHFNSPRKNMRFIGIDCGALHENLLESELFGHVKGAFTGAVTAKKGLFEVADGGTLFLDEIGHTSFALQAKLLRVLQERVFTPVGDTRERRADVRLIAATNKDLDAMVKEGSFREELFYRLNIVPVVLPPLRNRREDIAALASHFIRKFCDENNRTAVPTLSTEALQLMMDYSWPGNVRELENAIQRAVVLTSGETITADRLPAAVRTASVVSNVSVPRSSKELKAVKKQLREQAVEEVERRFVIEALRRSGGNVSRAAADVGMLRPNFQALMRQYHLSTPTDISDESATQ